MKKGTLIFAGVTAACAVVLVAPDAWAATGFERIDQGINNALTAAMGFGGAVGTGGVMEAVTAARFGHGGYMQGGGKTALTGGGILGSGAIATTVLGSGTSFSGELLPTALSWFHAVMAALS